MNWKTLFSFVYFYTHTQTIKHLFLSALKEKERLVIQQNPAQKKILERKVDGRIEKKKEENKKKEAETKKKKEYGDRKKKEREDRSGKKWKTEIWMLSHVFYLTLKVDLHQTN